MEKKASLDRRAFARIPTNKNVRIIRPDSLSCEPMDGILADISQTGASVISPEPIEAGEWIVLQPNEGEDFEITAVVIRTLSSEPGAIKLACIFPEPLDYSVAQLLFR